MSSTAFTASPWSCHSCRRRKIRCDRRDPCTSCLRAGLDCGFPSDGKLPTRRHDVSEQPRSQRKRQTELLNRLTHLETLVDELSAQVQADARIGHVFHEQNVTNKEQLKEYPEAEPILPQQTGHLVNDGNGKAYIGNVVWASIYSQLKSIRKAVVDDGTREQWHCDDINTSVPWTPSFLWFDATFDTLVAYPVISRISPLWDVFLDRMNMFIRILHVPSITRIIQQIASQPGTYRLEPGTEALIVSISLAAVTSLAGEEVMTLFGQAKTDLLFELTVAAEKAFSQANVLNTSDLNVIRAFLIYLESMVITRGTRAIWSMNGLLIRAAQSAGLHRDPAHFADISPFETEMRRRLWWHICFLDSRVSGCQVSEVSLTEDMFDTLTPSNVEDEDMHPDMTSLPTIKEHRTDSSVSIIRCDLWRLLRKIQSSMSTLPHHTRDKPSGKELLQSIRDARERIKNVHASQTATETKHIFAEKIAEIDLQNMEICVRCYSLSHSQTTQDQPPQTRSDDCFRVALRGCESIRALLDDVSISKWAWVFQESIFWPPLSCVLMELCNRRWDSMCERAWVVAEQNARHLTKGREGDEVFYTPLANLLDTARKHREQELKKSVLQIGEPSRQDPMVLCVPSPDGVMLENAQSIYGNFLDTLLL